MALSLMLAICPDGQAETLAALEAVIEAMVQVNVLYYERFPRGPCCAGCAGVVYDAPAERDYITADDELLSVESMMVRGKARCGSIAAMEAARMRVIERRHAVVKLRPTHPVESFFHAFVFVDGQYHDPTAELIREQAAPDSGCSCEV